MFFKYACLSGQAEGSYQTVTTLRNRGIGVESMVPCFVKLNFGYKSPYLVWAAVPSRMEIAFLSSATSLRKELI